MDWMRISRYLNLIRRAAKQTMNWQRTHTSFVFIRAIFRWRHICDRFLSLYLCLYSRDKLCTSVHVKVVVSNVRCEGQTVHWTLAPATSNIHRSYPPQNNECVEFAICSVVCSISWVGGRRLNCFNKSCGRAQISLWFLLCRNTKWKTLAFCGNCSLSLCGNPLAKHEHMRSHLMTQRDKIVFIIFVHSILVSTLEQKIINCIASGYWLSVYAKWGTMDLKD